ncbi:MAG: helix-turn-helix domain-containing protein [Desulfovibrio sp.]|uniref:helix-turn-helix domain-containing protein n=1 Tax=Desulfovibrio sp. TaxID=885 RepID=UPI0025C0DF3D|nr:helix-turn-helix domain-containing protein [Desulfovibrio sp.]MBS6830803.1 helix-turn-helix domain-containing protein [Desulfovibrio sp.]
MPDTDYPAIFSAHIRRLLEERAISQRDFSKMAGLSTAYLSAVLNGTGNPTLKSMQAIAKAFAIPLPLLLKPIESDEWKTALAVAQAVKNSSGANLPPGYEVVEHVVLPAYRAFEVREWAKTTQKKIKPG